MAIKMDKATDNYPVIKDRRDFDQTTGNRVERLIFNYRALIILAITLVSLFLGWQATRLVVNANFDRMIPTSHPYIQNFIDNRNELSGLGNSLRIVVENTKGDIFDPAYLETLKQINDEVFLTPGLDRPWMKSLWTPILRWTQVTEDGMRGGPVMPDHFDGSPEKLDELRENLGRSGAPGRIVANDYKSSMITVPVLDRYPDSGLPIDYKALSQSLEEKVRSKEGDGIRVHIVGFSKLVGDLIKGLDKVLMFFGISALIATVFVYGYSRCLRSTLMLVAVSILGVVWLLGLMHLAGYELDPYTILVPFLIFAIGLSHGAQKMNGIMQDIGRGTDKYVAARYTFRRLFMAGLTALLANVVGFAVLMIVDIPVIRDLALTTSIGVSVLIFTKLILIPILLSYTGVSQSAANRSLREQNGEKGILNPIWGFFAAFTRRKWAVCAIVVAALLSTTALFVRHDLQIGDLSAGAPELWPDSRYNRDVAFVAANYGLSNDQFAVMVKTPPNVCDHFSNLVEADRLGWELSHVPGVQATESFATLTKRGVSGTYEGYYKWNSIVREPRSLGYAASQVLVNNPDVLNPKCSVFPVMAYLTDHKASTLSAVLERAEAFAQKHNSAEVQFLPAAGSAGIEAVTNIVVKESFYKMHALLYVGVILLCLITFRSWRAVLVALIPLLITTVLCEALMVWLGIGVKVATLPVIALGVGVGVDYALYLLSIQLLLQRRGYTLFQAYTESLQFTGRVVALVGMTMAAGVITWAWSPIKFQADMGILLAFMFLWNMLGALILIPALSYFLLQSREQRKQAQAQSVELEQMEDTPAAKSSHKKALAARTV
ncbi:efflux RND transporter permease subunit [Pseudomonas fluorescens]|jgi:predicted RND superfamily exporter protein|uniref:efflux RND transporter permease subunit n=1 Tax=Pseudomonas fluorescens TaxID=294 RepID=UPI001911EE03|nr:MMPL family transporter [Pseudomonas fluorescens]